MGDHAGTIVPIWRTRLALVLAAWMALTVLILLGGWRIAEVAPLGLAAPVVAGLLAVPPIGLLAWGFWHMLREPVTGWIAPSVLLAFCGAMVPASLPLADLGARLNFMAHRPAYDAIVADLRAGRLAGYREPDGWIAGARDGVRYRYPPGRSDVIDFVWTRARLVDAGVRYDAAPCRPSRQIKCVSAGEPLAGDYYHYFAVAF
jgi:hypothetical protein